MSTLDPSGRPVSITTGITHDERGAWVAALAIGVEVTATAVLTRPVVDQAEVNMQATLVNVGPAQIRTEWARDTLGRPVPITTRRAQNSRDEAVSIMSIGGAAGAAVFTDPIRERLVSNMRTVLAAAAQLRRGGL